ncbi:hypothetical protein K438DRAFT_716021 [Mycena galopus ATCC 62051]|nr:hypothetical protein K438DRAFT_716021 [Mycena galopus ATCC 62051]
MLYLCALIISGLLGACGALSHVVMRSNAESVTFRVDCTASTGDLTEPCIALAQRISPLGLLSFGPISTSVQHSIDALGKSSHSATLASYATIPSPSGGPTAAPTTISSQPTPSSFDTIPSTYLPTYLPSYTSTAAPTQSSSQSTTQPSTAAPYQYAASSQPTIPSQSTISPDSRSKKSFPAGTIVGITLGALVACIVAILASFYALRMAMKRRPSANPLEPFTGTRGNVNNNKPPLPLRQDETSANSAEPPQAQVEGDLALQLRTMQRQLQELQGVVGHNSSRNDIVRGRMSQHSEGLSDSSPPGYSSTV